MFEFREYTQKVNNNRDSADNSLGFEIEPESKIVALNFPADSSLSGPMTAVCSGAARGGSSILPYILQRLGLPMGTFEADNFEDIEMLRNRTNIERLRQVIEKRNGEAERWGFKIPSLRRGQFGFFDEALRKPVYLYIFRNPALAAGSVISRAAAEAYPRDRGGFSNAIQGVVQSYLEFVVFMRQTNAPCLLVPMDNLREKSTAAVGFLSKRLGLEVDEATLADIAEQVRVSGYKSRKAL